MGVRALAVGTCCILTTRKEGISVFITTLTYYPYSQGIRIRMTGIAGKDRQAKEGSRMSTVHEVRHA